jgi:hypothetical protein
VYKEHNTRECKSKWVREIHQSLPLVLIMQGKRVKSKEKQKQKYEQRREIKSWYKHYADWLMDVTSRALESEHKFFFSVEWGIKEYEIVWEKWIKKHAKILLFLLKKYSSGKEKNKLIFFKN